jgi:beta-galactosidase
MKDGFDALNRERQPGPLVPVLGGRVEQFYALLENVPVDGPWGKGSATVWAEWLDKLAPDVAVQLRYGAGNDWLTGEPAAISRQVGKGTITYLGATLDPALMASVARQWLKNAGVDSPVISVAPGVSVCRRVGAGREVYVIANFSKGPQDVALPGAMTDVLNGNEASRMRLARYGVAVLTRPLK